MAPHVISLVLIVLQGLTPTPTATPLPPPTALESAGAIVAIVLALVAAILGYRIIRGGRGL